MGGELIARRAMPTLRRKSHSARASFQGILLTQPCSALRHVVASMQFSCQLLVISGGGQRSAVAIELRVLVSCRIIEHAVNSQAVWKKKATKSALEAAMLIKDSCTAWTGCRIASDHRVRDQTPLQASQSACTCTYAFQCVPPSECLISRLLVCPRTRTLVRMHVQL